MAKARPIDTVAVPDAVLSPRSRVRLRVPQHSLVERPRLLDLLSRHDHARLILLQAPAGYGKTSLLQQWANHCLAAGDSVAWISLDARDRDPMAFASHLNMALEEHRESGRGLVERTAGSQHYYGWQALIQQICERVDDNPCRCRIIIDDIHQIAESPALDALQTLIDEAPSAMQLVFATRGEAGLPLGRIRAHHEMLELGASDLRFIEDETQAYLKSKADTDTDIDQVRLLQDRSEGWIVGIKLFSMALSLEPENQRILESFTGERRQIADFFLEDVFARQPDELQDFLLRSSLLEQFSPALCDAALEHTGSRELIARCEASGLFLQTMDQTRSWYRYHHLFAGFLRRQLQDRRPGVAAAIYRRAAQWLTASGNHVEAFDYAIKGQDPIYAADILDQNCEAMFAAGLQPTLQLLASQLPAHILALYPRLMLSLAWRLTAQWRLSEARSLVAVAERRLDELARSSEADPADLKWLRLVVSHRETQIAHASYEVEALENQCSSALDGRLDFGNSPYLMGSFQNSLQYAQREQYKLSKVDRLDALAREQVQRTGAVHGEVFIAGISGPSLFLMGQSERAKAMLQSGLEVAQRVGGRDDPLGAVVATTLASLHYELNEIERAQALIDHYVPLMTSAGFVDQLLNGWVTQARLQLLRGDHEACLGTLDIAAEFGSRHELDRLRIGVSAEHLRVMLKLGRPDDAARFARRRGLSSHRAANLTRGQFKYTVLDGVLAMANCRLMAADDQFGDALILARQWRSFLTAAQAVPAAVEWDILFAELLLMSGERLSAQRALAQALAKAAPARLLRRFLDEGEPIAGLLRQMAQAEAVKEDAVSLFLREIVGLLEPVEEQRDDEDDEDSIAICGRMTNREIEILSMAGAGMLNRQIGEQLGLTEGTVKWYLQQVYDKVGIRNRKQVVARVRRLGLIP
jgi:LuxR family maltose regulon positive regulatory protein